MLHAERAALDTADPSSAPELSRETASANLGIPISSRRLRTLPLLCARRLLVVTARARTDAAASNACRPSGKRSYRSPLHRELLFLHRIRETGISGIRQTVRGVR
jgi:hypothetical protein